MESDEYMKHERVTPEMLHEIGESFVLLSNSLKDILHQYEVLIEELAGQEAAATIRRIQSNSSSRLK